MARTIHSIYHTRYRGDGRNATQLGALASTAAARRPMALMVRRHMCWLQLKKSVGWRTRIGGRARNFAGCQGPFLTSRVGLARPLIRIAMHSAHN